jgi:hypothetical protein
MTTDLDRLDQIEKLLGEIRASLTSASVVRVTTAAELTAALQVGGQIRLAPGVYAGNFVATKPAVVTEEQLATVELVPANPLPPTLTVLTDGFVMRGWMTTIRNGDPSRECVVVGDRTAVDPMSQPNDVLFEGVTLKAGANGGRRGFVLHARKVTLLSVRVEGFWFSGQDSQGVWCHNGPGPYEILNSHIEGSGENIMFGGDKLSVPVNPTGIVRSCELFKPQAWRQAQANGLKPTVKNSFELKEGIDVVFENNVIDGCWPAGQNGTPIVLTPRNQDGSSTHVQVDRVIISNNRIINCPDGYGVNILGRDDINVSQPMLDLTIEGNLFDGCWGGLLISKADTLSALVRRNTFLVRGKLIHFAAGQLMKQLTYRENVGTSGSYGIHGDSAPVGEGALRMYCASYDVTGNVFEQSAQRTIPYPAGNRVLNPGELATLLDANKRMLDGSAGY